MDRTNTRIIAVTSGKGGVGKTNISVNLALALGEQGFRTCLFDADLGLANINILLGINPEYTLEDVIEGRKELHDILIKGFHGVDIIPGGSGVEKLVNLDKNQIRYMAESLSGLSHYDFIIFDTSAGISTSVLAFCMAAAELLVIITPEPTSMTDAYSLLKVLVMNSFHGAVKLVVNQCKTINHAKKIYQTFNQTIRTYLNINTSLTGVLVSDPRVVEAVKKQEPFFHLFPNTAASKCIHYLTKALLNHSDEDLVVRDLLPFWEKCLYIMKQPLFMKEGIHEPPKTDHHPNHATDLSNSNDYMGMKDHMNKLVSGVVMVSEELRQIKELLGNGHIGVSIAPQNSKKVLRQSVDNKKYILDYEAFLNKHGVA